MNIAALLAGLFSGIIGSMGLGGGTVLIIYLSIFTETEQLNAQGINLLFFIPIALLSVIIYAVKKKINWKLTIPIALFGLIGTTVGLFCTQFFGGGITEKVFGGLLIIIGISEIFFKVKKENPMVRNPQKQKNSKGLCKKEKKSIKFK